MVSVIPLKSSLFSNPDLCDPNLLASLSKTREIGPEFLEFLDSQIIPALLICMTTNGSPDEATKTACKVRKSVERSYFEYAKDLKFAKFKWELKKVIWRGHLAALRTLVRVTRLADISSFGAAALYAVEKGSDAAVKILVNSGHVPLSNIIALQKCEISDDLKKFLISKQQLFTESTYC